MIVERDEFGQLAGDWTDVDLDVLAILEEVASPDEPDGNPEKTLAAYLADIYDAIGGRQHAHSPTLAVEAMVCPHYSPDSYEESQCGTCGGSHGSDTP